jgi:hypothetical protein
MRAYRYTVLLLYCVALLGACIYVPWKADRGMAHYPLGYAYLWAPPTKDSTGLDIALFASVDITRLVVELVAASAAGGILLLLGELASQGGPVLRSLRERTKRRAVFIVCGCLLSLGGGWAIYWKWQQHVKEQRMAVCQEIRAQIAIEAAQRLGTAPELPPPTKGGLTIGEFLDASDALLDKYNACVKTAEGK